tara:strand:- start:234 stop:404 length:171 start_codon:yes stop_codon:yes gene_type:complete
MDNLKSVALEIRKNILYSIYCAGSGHSGEPDELAEKYGIDTFSIVDGIKRLLGRIS